MQALEEGLLDILKYHILILGNVSDDRSTFYPELVSGFE
jgi:hypothetical protein